MDDQNLFLDSEKEVVDQDRQIVLGVQEDIFVPRITLDFEFRNAVFEFNFALNLITLHSKPIRITLPECC